MPTTVSDRTTDRVRVAVPARLTWRDASGAVRMVSVTTRDIGPGGAYVLVNTAAAIPLHRLVHLQVEREARDAAGVPEPLRQGRVLAAVWRIGSCRRATGTPEGYALRFLSEPAQIAWASESRPMAVAS